MKVKTVVAVSIATGLSVGIFRPVIYAAKKESIGPIVVTDQPEKLIATVPHLLAPLNNNPMGWNATFIANAYINYQYNKHVDIELLTTNLLNEYYVDLLTRSLMPARAVRLSVTSRF